MQTLVTGSIANDYLMSFPGHFSEHILPERIDVLSVSFLVDSLRREPGGCAANIAYNLALLGERPLVMATVGTDFEPDRARLAAAGVDTRFIRAIPGESTASFFVSTDLDNRQIASFYIGAMGHAAGQSLHDLAGEEVALVVISPNAPDAMLKLVAECKALGRPYVYDPSQQIVRLDGSSLREGIEGARCFVANTYEMELIHEKTGLDEAAIRGLCPVVVVTHGEQGSVIHAEGARHDIPIAAPRQVVDPTGVGDAYRTAIVHGLVHGLPWDIAGRVGALCATYALESLGTQAHRFTIDQFLARYAEQFGPVPAPLSRHLQRPS